MEIMLCHPRCHRALGMRIGQRTIPLGRARGDRTRQPLNASTGNHKETQDSTQRTESNPCPFGNCKGRGNKAPTYRKTSRKAEGLGCPRMQTFLLQTLLHQTPLICAVFPAPQPSQISALVSNQPTSYLRFKVAGTWEYYTHHPSLYFRFLVFVLFSQYILLFTVHSTFNSVPFIPYSQPLL